MIKNKLSTVKNPLTVIAIFAGTAEISGTAILPLLETQSQQIYIWFLMLFPLILIVFFFITLNWNHKVLYAPSDFSDENHFIDILKKPSIQEAITGIEIDLQDSEYEKEPTETVDKRQEKSFNVDSIVPDESTKSKRGKDTEILRDLTRQRMKEAQMAELLVLSKLETELNSPIQREMMIKSGNNKIIFDGVVQIGSNLTGIEVKYMRKRNSLNTSNWINFINRFEYLYQSLNDSQKKSFSIILAIVTDDNLDEIKQITERKLSKLSFPVQIRVYDFDRLRNELTHGN